MNFTYQFSIHRRKKKELKIKMSTRMNNNWSLSKGISPNDMSFIVCEQ